MRKQIDIEELAIKLHELFDCEIVEIYEHQSIFFPNSTRVYCHDADQLGIGVPICILPVSLMASDPKYYKGNQIEYLFDFTKSEKENEQKV